MKKSFVLILLILPGLLLAQVKKRKEIPPTLTSKLAAADAQYQTLLSLNNKDKRVAEVASQYHAILETHGKNSQTLSAIRKLAAIEAYKLDSPKKAIALLEPAVTIPGLAAKLAAEIKLELADVYVMNNQPWDAILLYGQVDKDFENQDIGNEAKYRSARLSFYQGNFAFAKSQLDYIKASTSQLAANDALNLSLLISDHLEKPADTLALHLFAAAELMQFRNDAKSAFEKLDSIPIVHPEHSLTDDSLMAKSRIYIKRGDYNQAEGLLKELISHPTQSIWTDDAIFMLAGLYENQLRQPEQAKALYQKLITDFPGSMFTAEARIHFRRLRGDKIGS